MKHGCGKSKCGWGWIVWILLVIGAINWGLVGIGNFVGGGWDVISLVFGSIPWLRDALFILIGIAGVLTLFGGCRCATCQTCRAPGGEMQKPEAGEGGSGV